MKIRRLISTLVVLVVMMLSFAAAAAPVLPQSEEELGNETSTVSPRAEETEWVYRIYNGYLQKRLWSLTRGIWLTDWIYC